LAYAQLTTPKPLSGLERRHPDKEEAGSSILPTPQDSFEGDATIHIDHDHGCCKERNRSCGK
jgi:hypothetical protein